MISNQRVGEVSSEYLHYLSCYFIYVAVIGPVAFVGNLVVLVSVVLYLRRQCGGPVAAYMLLGNIAMADTLNSVSFVLGIGASHEGGWEKYFCVSHLGVIVCGSLISMLTICLIAVERFVYIAHGIMYEVWLTPSRTSLLIGVVWALGFSCGLFPILAYAYSAEESRWDDCEFIKRPLWVGLFAGVTALLALTLTSLVYTLLYCRARRACSRLGTARLQLRSFLVVFLCSISFLLLWGPYICGGFAYKLYCERRGESCESLFLALTFPLSCLGFTNCLVNPVVYAWWHPPYNRALRKVLCPRSVGRVDEPASLNSPLDLPRHFASGGRQPNQGLDCDL